jgi:enoyl-CoA hydratase
MRQIRRVVLSGPHKNALSTALMTAVIEALDDAGGEPVLLTGDGDAFSAGLDLREVAALDATGMERFLDLLESMAATLYRYPGPVAAAVNGHAIAGGCVLTLCSDYRVVARHDRLRIGLNEVALGVAFPPRTLAAVLSRLPRQHCEVVLLGAQLYGPDDALRLGLVDAVADDPVTEATRWLEVVATHDAAAYATTKLAVRDSLQEAAQAWPGWLRQALGTWTGPNLRAAVARLLGASRRSEP